MIDLRPVKPEEAPGDVRAVFDRIRDVLALPWVPTIYQAFAMYPEYLKLSWEAVAPRARTAVFLDETERVREAAVELAAWYRPERSWLGDGARREHAELGRCLDAFLLGDAKLAILAGAYLLGLEGDVPRGLRLGDVEERRCDEERAAATRVRLVRPDAAPAPIRRVYKDIEHTLGLPLVNSDYQAVAAWPGVLERAWPDLRASLGRIEYRLAEERLGGYVDEAARRMGLARAVDRAAIRQAGLSAAQLANLSALIYMFRRLLPGLCLQVAMLRRGVRVGE